MKKRIIIAGANGFLGQALIEHLHSNYELIGLVRKEQPNAFCVSYCRWDGRTLGPWKDKFDGAYAVINLAGRSVDCRYNEKNKAQILSSRIESTRVLAEAIQSCKNPPQVWLNSASATIYEHSLDQPNGESSESIGSGFSVDVCLAWEKEFYRTELILRKVALRTTLVIGKKGGVYPVFRKLAMFGLGGTQGPGNQMVSWIHIEDFCRAVEFCLKEEVEGPVNMAAPDPMANKDFMKNLRQSLGVKIGLPTPKFLLEFGAILIRTETELILKSRYVVPEKLTRAGFKFYYPNIPSCFENLSRREPSS